MNKVLHSNLAAVLERGRELMAMFARKSSKEPRSQTKLLINIPIVCWASAWV